MKYKLVWRKNPQDRSKQKLYATPVMDGKVTQNDLKNEIVLISSLSKGDVSNAIESFLEVIPKYLLMGKSVSLGDLGTLRLSFTSEGVDEEKDFVAPKSKACACFSLQVCRCVSLSRTLSLRKQIDVCAVETYENASLHFSKKS